MPVYLGLDCGGSSCRSIAADGGGEVVFHGQGGPANLASTPPGRLAQHLRKAVLGAPDPAAVCGCFAGLLTSEDRSRAADLLSGLFPGSIVRVEPDYAAAFAASEGADLCIVAGTGSIVCSHANGTLSKSGGKGYLLGDFGSAFQYGRRALERFLEEPLASSAELRVAVEARFRSLEEAEILARVYRSGMPAAQLAKLLPAFARDARSGEAYAAEFLETQTDRLALIVLDHVETHLPARRRIVASLAGGLWESSPIFREALDRSLRRRAPGRTFELIRISKPPVYGALRLARETQS